MLLCNGGYYGTLAAIRSLGRAGIPVVTVDPSAMAAGRYSKYSSSHLRCPPFEQTTRWAEWLTKLGRLGPRRSIYATSDAVAFALARHREELQTSFDLFQPGLATMMRLLDKSELLKCAESVGIETPETWFPQSRQDAKRIAKEVGGKILIKPRSQLSVRSYTKGIVAGPEPEAIVAEYDRFVALGAHDAEFAQHYPAAMLPMFQRYYPKAMEAIYSLSGFRDRTGQRTTMLAAYKLLQSPRRLGVGLCFEAAAVDPDLADRVTRLCELTGYYGVFELEFIPRDGRALLIDFNPRFYNQMQFDIARGLDLPGLAYASSIGDERQVTQLMSLAPHRSEATDVAFCDRFGMNVAIGAQRIFGTMSRQDALHWQAWRQTPGRTIVDAVRDAADPLPATMDAALKLMRYMRHPRAFVRQTALAR